MRRRPTGHAHVPVHAVLFLEYVRGPTNPSIEDKERRQDWRQFPPRDWSLLSEVTRQSLYYNQACDVRQSEIVTSVKAWRHMIKAHDVSQLERVTSANQSTWRHMISALALLLQQFQNFRKESNTTNAQIEHRFPQATTLLQLTAPCWLGYFDQECNFISAV